MEPIRFYNRHTQQMETEAIYGEGFLKWAYGNPIGKIALHAFVKRPFFSRWYGQRMDKRQSASRIMPFLQNFDMNDEDFVKSADEFTSFNEFFARHLKPEARPIEHAPENIIFPADGRHLGFQNANEIQSVFVKGQSFDLEQLLGDKDLAAQYTNGALVLSRLCPVDYHRFHFPCDGTPGKTTVINGPLFSVSPIALRQRISYLWENKRAVTKLQSDAFGQVLLLEIGATCVGTIHQTFEANRPINKGDEKGTFYFGGSSTITIFEPGKVELAKDLIEHSQQQTELYAKMGTIMATST